MAIEMGIKYLEQASEDRKQRQLNRGLGERYGRPQQYAAMCRVLIDSHILFNRSTYDLIDLSQTCHNLG